MPCVPADQPAAGVVLRAQPAQRQHSFTAPGAHPAADQKLRARLQLRHKGLQEGCKTHARPRGCCGFIFAQALTASRRARSCTIMRRDDVNDASQRLVDYAATQCVRSCWWPQGVTHCNVRGVTCISSRCHLHLFSSAACDDDCARTQSKAFRYTSCSKRVVQHRRLLRAPIRLYVARTCISAVVC